VDARNGQVPGGGIVEAILFSIDRIIAKGCTRCPIEGTRVPYFTELFIVFSKANNIL
jgi:hypothetical protein